MSIIDTAKDVYDLVKKGTTIDLQERVMQLREEALALQQENNALKVKVSELEKALDIQTNLQWDGKAYLRTPDQGKEGPYCQVCYDSRKQLIRLQRQTSTIDYDESGRPTGFYHYYSCLSCKNQYEAN
jgi:hypothetical protein